MAELYHRWKSVFNRAHWFSFVFQFPGFQMSSVFSAQHQKKDSSDFLVVACKDRGKLSLFQHFVWDFASRRNIMLCNFSDVAPKLCRVTQCYISFCRLWNCYVELCNFFEPAAVSNTTRFFCKCKMTGFFQAATENDTLHKASFWGQKTLDGEVSHRRKNPGSLCIHHKYGLRKYHKVCSSKG